MGKAMGRLSREGDFWLGLRSCLNTGAARFPCNSGANGKQQKNGATAYFGSFFAPKKA
jgi:hypothetical protein